MTTKQYKRRSLIFASMALPVLISGLLGASTYAQQNETASAAAQVVQNAGQNNPISQPAAAIWPETVAQVNGTRISRDTLIAENVRSHGQEVLQRILNRALILAECKRQNIIVTRADVDAEIDRLAKRFKIDRSQFLTIVQKDNNMTPQQYAEEVIWPKLALDALVAGKIQVSEEEIQRKYLSKFGPSLGMQIIVCPTKAKAEEVRAKVVAAPDTFGDVAKVESKDVLTASNKGRMQPIFQYSLPDVEIEKQLFSMNIGDISPVIGPYGPEKNFIIFKCENKYDSIVPPDKIGQLKEKLKADAASEKLKGAAQLLFEQLGKEAKIENILAKPELRAQYPNLAATVNGQPIYLASVVEMGLRLYGKQDLETLISTTLIEQELKKVAVTVSDQEIDTEIWIRAAETTMPLADGSPNIKEYLRSELNKYGVPEDSYRKTIVWPIVALKKLSAGLVKITDEDLQKSFEANFGASIQ
ncbi:MAG: SurA N-terminal domain-containing protein [Thermoguttaceae bacterium]|nr:SurA N-terminal domain-containing protein [Thermoguttaceae bacterium]